MGVIIKDELVGDGEESVYSFSRLKILKLKSLDITKFASKPNTEIQFPSLESIHLWNCNNIESFWSGSFIAPKLKLVKLGCPNMHCFLSKKRMVEISGCLRMLSFTSEPLVVPKLHHVTLDNCPEMKWFIRGDPNNNGVVELPSLEIVSIAHCDGMKSFSSGGIEAPKLCELEVNRKDFSKGTNEELQYLLSDLPKRPIYIREESDDSD